MHWIITFITFVFAFCQILLWKWAFYPDIFSLFAFLFLYFVHDSSAVLMGILKNWGRRWNEKWKVTRKDQLKAATYEWLL